MVAPLANLPRSGISGIIMGPHVRKLLILALAMIAFLASNFAMANGNMIHDASGSDHHVAVVSCHVDHSHSAASGSSGACETQRTDSCGDGPSCCSNTCHAILLASFGTAFSGAVVGTSPVSYAAGLATQSLQLERPPRTSRAG